MNVGHVYIIQNILRNNEYTLYLNSLLSLLYMEQLFISFMCTKVGMRLLLQEREGRAFYSTK